MLECDPLYTFLKSVKAKSLHRAYKIKWSYEIIVIFWCHSPSVCSFVCAHSPI